MKKLNKIQSLVFMFGACLILIGAMLGITRSPLSPYIYSVGAVCFSSMQLAASYEGSNIVLRRLRRQQIIGAVLLLLNGIPMFMNFYNFGFARNNEWILVLTIASVLELYSAFRIPAEEEKESKK